MTILRNTRAMCRTCGKTWPAEVVEREGRILGLLHCPEHPAEHLLSTDAALYRELDGRSHADRSGPPPAGLRFALNYISVTNACNFACAICASAAVPPEQGVFLGVDEICRRADAMRRQGGRILHLFGGEPTLHPDLLEIVRRLAAMGLSVGVVTNGALLGRDSRLARDLKTSGASRVCLQFDSFDQAELEALKRNALDLKRQAIANAIAAGLDVGLNCTVTAHNLAEAAKLLAHGLELGPRVRNMTFGISARVGRFDYPSDCHVDREMILAAMVAGAGDLGLSMADILPLPGCPPWGLQPHPDCGVHVPFVRAPWGNRPLNHYFDLTETYRRLAGIRGKPGWWGGRVLPAWHLLAAVRPGKRRQVARIAWGLLRGNAAYSLVNVAVTNYRANAFLDTERLDRCASAFHTSQGPVKGCLHFYLGKDYPGSREYETARGGC